MQDDKILHQDDTEEVIEDVLDDEVVDRVDEQMAATSDHAAIANVGAVGASYVQAEVQAVRNAVNEILDVLRDAGLIPEE